MSIEQCKPVELPAVADPDGELVFAEGERHVPFPIARAFFVHDVPEAAVRGVHAHLALEEVVFCVAGRLEIEIDDGVSRRTVALEDPRTGLYLPPMIWHRLSGFAPGTVYFVLASDSFDEDDYIREYDEFLEMTRAAAPS